LCACSELCQFLSENEVFNLISPNAKFGDALLVVANVDCNKRKLEDSDITSSAWVYVAAGEAM
jgi:hypothetical protein